ncbi:hypothetical protein [uncultured Sphingomonas sp.]|uniref:hypothetical protein n=1 Tax=uncultured Sphingomonas sp. TaxID=158754 RepID=UPI0035C9B50B
MKIGVASVGATRESLGVFGGWGAFRDRSPDRCVATAVPARTGRHPTWRPFASVALWPGRHRRDVVFVRLSAARAAGTPVTLSVGDRRFRLVGEGSGVWSPDPATDHALVAALRSEHSLSIAAISARGEPFADSYLLAGAATAIDAAALGCSRSGDPSTARIRTKT